MEFRDIAAVILLVAGVFFFALGTLGLWRFPDVYSRAHAATKCDTLGCGLILLGLVLELGLSMSSIKLFLIIGFIWATNSTAAHAIGRAAYTRQYPLAKGTKIWSYQGKGE